MKETIFSTQVLVALISGAVALGTAYIVNVLSKRVQDRKAAKFRTENPREASIYDEYDKAMQRLGKRLDEADKTIQQMRQELGSMGNQLDAERRQRIAIEDNVYKVARKYNFDPAEVLQYIK